MPPPPADVLSLIGNTPMVRLGRIGAGLPVPVFAKCEHLSPGGSVKDRIALAIVEHGERAGLLRPGATLVAATAGNTGDGRGGAFVAGVGTGGTITGVGRFLKSRLPDVRIVLAEPVGSRLAHLVDPSQPDLDAAYQVEGIGGSVVPGVLDLSVIDSAER